MNQTHIDFLEIEGRPVVKFDDYELFDWFDDIFTEQHGIQYDFVVEETGRAGTSYLMHFARTVSLSTLREIVNTIDTHEIERVWLLNNAPRK